MEQEFFEKINILNNQIQTIKEETKRTLQNVSMNSDKILQKAQLQQEKYSKSIQEIKQRTIK